MRDYAKVMPKFWTGETCKALRARTSQGASRGSEGVTVALYLMSSPMSNMLGLYCQPILYMAHETGLGLEGAWKGLRDCIEVGFCKYDETSETVWVVEMAAFQIAQELKASDNRCAGIQRDYDGLPKNPFLGEFFDRYQRSFHLNNRRGGEGASKPLLSQEQEQEQEQKELSSLRSDSSTAPPSTDLLGGKPTDLNARRAERLAAVTEDAVSAYNAILGRPNGKLASISKVGRKTRRKQVNRILQDASEVCLELFGDKRITPEFWQSYFETCDDDPWLRGDGPYTGEHANWRPSFEYFTRPETLLKVFERATDADAAA